MPHAKRDNRKIEMKRGCKMSLNEFEENGSGGVKPQTLSNVQMELLKLFSTNLEHDDLMEIKEILANYFAQKTIDDADNIWNRKKMSTDTMEVWLYGK